MHTLLQDLKFGLRMLGKTPVVSSVAALSLALGIAAATTMLSFQIWKESFSMLNFGNGSAVAFIMVLISVGFILAIVKALPSDLFGEE